jgi:hypothetical protein
MIIEYTLKIANCNSHFQNGNFHNDYKECGCLIFSNDICDKCIIENTDQCNCLNILMNPNISLQLLNKYYGNMCLKYLTLNPNFITYSSIISEINTTTIINKYIIIDYYDSIINAYIHNSKDKFELNNIIEKYSRMNQLNIPILVKKYPNCNWNFHSLSYNHYINDYFYELYYLKKWDDIQLLSVLSFDIISKYAGHSSIFKLAINYISNMEQNLYIQTNPLIDTYNFLSYITMNPFVNKLSNKLINHILSNNNYILNVIQNDQSFNYSHYTTTTINTIKNNSFCIYGVCKYIINYV